MADRECALNECTTQADKWTMCDQHAQSMGIYTPFHPEPPRRETPTPKPRITTTGMVTLPPDHIHTLLHAMNHTTIKALTRETGISGTALYRIRERGEKVRVGKTIAQRIVRWINDGAKIPPMPDFAAVSAIGRYPLEAHHFNIIKAAFHKTGSFQAAEREIGVSASTLTRIIRTRKPGDLAEPDTLKRIQAWGEKNTGALVPSDDIRQDMSPLTEDLQEKVRKAYRKCGAARVGKAINVSAHTVRDIANNQYRAVQPRTKVLIDRWVEKGCPVEAPLRTNLEDHHLVELEQRHVDVVTATVHLLGSSWAASIPTRIDPKVVDKLLTKRAGHTATLGVVRKIELWEKTMRKIGGGDHALQAA